MMKWQMTGLDTGCSLANTLSKGCIRFPGGSPDRLTKRATYRVSVSIHAASAKETVA